MWSGKMGPAAPRRHASCAERTSGTGWSQRLLLIVHLRRDCSSMRWITPILIVCALAAPSPVRGQANLEAVVDSLAAEYVASGQLAGMSVGVTRGADTLLLKAYGYADLEWDVPMPVDAIHEIGSVTKQFTSVAMLQLWSQGKVDLDADITEYLPNYDTRGRAIPLRRLFDHTSGIKGYTEMPNFGTVATRALPRDSLVAMFSAEPFDFEPGSALIYNNSAYFLLGLIIEAVSDQPYADYLEEHVFPLAEMDDTSYCSNDNVVERRAHGYQPGPGGLELADYIDHTWPYAAGSMCSTVGDLISWNRQLHGGGVLSGEAYALMTTPAPLADGTPVRYAMGITQYTTPSGRVIEHGGGIPGFLSQSRYYPEEDVVVVVLLNTAGPPGPDAVADAIGAYLFGDDHLPPAGSNPGDLGRFTGTYRGPARGRALTVVVGIEENELTLQFEGDPSANALRYIGETRFDRGADQFEFVMDGTAALALRMDQVGGHYVLERVDVSEPGLGR